MKKLTLLLLISLMVFVGCSQNEGTKMTTSKDHKVMVIAHRGASGYAPENTLAAMKKAIEMNAEMSELDVQETADGEMIILHDASLKRTTGVDKNIWETKYEELKGLDAGGWFSDEYKGEPIPTFQEIVDLVKGKMKINIELKTNKHEKMLAERTLKIVEANGFLDQVVFTSFKFAEIDKIRELNKEAKVGYLFGRVPTDVNVFTADVDLLSVNLKSVDAEFMKKAKANGKEVAVWTVNKPEDMKRMISLGVDAIITNYPDVLRKILDGKI
jgi:glycerophosphoryl diester phosphodiesterase